MENNLQFSIESIDLIDPIEEVVDFYDFVVIRTKRFQSSTNENVYGFSKKGLLLWQIQKIETLERDGEKFTGIDSPYSSLVKISDERIRLINYDGTKFEVDARTGEILTDPMDSRVGHRPW